MRRTKSSSPQSLLCRLFCCQRVANLPSLPFLRRQRLDIDLVTGAGIGVSSHAANGIHKLLVERPGRPEAIPEPQERPEYGGTSRSSKPSVMRWSGSVRRAFWDCGRRLPPTRRRVKKCKSQAGASLILKEKGLCYSQICIR